MNIISTGSLYHFRLARIFDVVAKSGFKAIELMLRPFGEQNYEDSWDIDCSKRLQEKHKVKIVSIHPPSDFEERADSYFDNIVTLAEKLQVSQIIIHIPKSGFADYAKWFAKFNPSNYPKMKFLFENMGKEGIYQGTENYSKYTNFCYDIAHAIKAGDDPEKELVTLSNVDQIHVSVFDNGHCHRSIRKNPEIIKKLLALRPKAIRCLELCPEAFSDMNNENDIIKELEINKEILS